MKELTTWDAFMLGWEFHFATKGHCFDARDVGRIFLCDFWPDESWRLLADRIRWDRCLDDGMVDAMKAIRAKLEAMATKGAGS